MAQNNGYTYAQRAFTNVFGSPSHLWDKTGEYAGMYSTSQWFSRPFEVAQSGQGFDYMSDPDHGIYYRFPDSAGRHAITLSQKVYVGDPFSSGVLNFPPFERVPLREQYDKITAYTSELLTPNTLLPGWFYKQAAKYTLTSIAALPYIGVRFGYELFANTPLELKFLAGSLALYKLKNYIPIYSPLRDAQAKYSRKLQTYFRTFTYNQPIIPNTQYTTHPEAAGVRRHNRQTIMDFVASTGLNSYEIHSGYHNQIPCFQNINVPADLNKTPTFEPIFVNGNNITPDYYDTDQFNNADILVVCEADWYLNLPQLCSYGKAIVILTKDTSQLCGQHGEIHFTPLNNNEFAYDVLGGGRYQHRSHKYDVDQFITQYDNGTNDTTRQMVHAVDRFPLYGNDVLVFMTPLPDLPTKFPLTPLYQQFCYPMTDDESVCLQLVYEKNHTEIEYKLYIAYPGSQRSFSIDWDTALAMDNANCVAKLTLSGAGQVLMREGQKFHERAKYLKDTIIKNRDAIKANRILASPRHVGALTTGLATSNGNTLQKPSDLGERPYYPRDYLWHRLHNFATGTYSIGFERLADATSQTYSAIMRATRPLSYVLPTVVNDTPKNIINMQTRHKLNKQLKKTLPASSPPPILKPVDDYHTNAFDINNFGDPNYKPIFVPLVPSRPVPEPDDGSGTLPKDDTQFKYTLKASRTDKLMSDNYLATFDQTLHSHFEPDYDLGGHSSHIMRPIAPLFHDPQIPVSAYTKGTNASFDAYYQRLYDVNRGPAQLDPKLFNLFGTIRKIIFAKFYDNAMPLTLEELKERVNTPKQLKRIADYERHTEHIMMHNFSSKNSAFIKAETSAKANPGQRNISNTNDDLFIEGSQFVFVAADIMKQRMPGYVFQHNAQTVGALIHQLALTYSNVCETDYSKYDGTQNLLTVLIEKLVFAAMFADPSRMFDVIDGCATSVFTMGEDSCYGPGYSRLSGSPQTSFSNSIINAVISVTAYIYHKHNKPYSESLQISPQDVEEGFDRIVVGGDDGLAFDIDATRYKELVEIMCLDIDLVVKPTSASLNMLALIYPSPRVSPCAGVDIPRFLSKVSYGISSSTLTPLQQIYAKLMGYQITFGNNNPLFTMLLDKLLVLLPKTDVDYYDDFERSYSYFMGQPLPIEAEMLTDYYSHIPIGTWLMLDSIVECESWPELVNEIEVRHTIDKIRPSIKQSTQDSAYEYLHPITHTQRDALGPEMVKMIPKSTTLKALRTMLLRVPTHVTTCYDLTVGWGNMSLIARQTLPDHTHFAFYYDNEERTKIMGIEGSPDLLMHADDIGLPLQVPHSERTQEAIFIIDLPFKNFDNFGKLKSELRSMFTRFNIEFSDYIIMNVPRYSSLNTMTFLDQDLGITGMTVAYQSNNSAIITNFTNTPAGKFMTPRYDLAEGKPSKFKNTQLNSMIYPEFALTPIEAALVNRQAADEHKIIATRSTAASGVRRRKPRK